ncbi:MAG: phage tail tape measure protein [Cetobacterium somerae]|uniref:phage tail tape measure protein n=1 Tax=Cetobacterium somerae TaxID=188913 RepID=UPI003F2F02ED
MASKIKDLYYEIGYKVNDEGMQQAEDNVDGLTSNVENLITKAAGLVAVGVAFKKVADYTKESVMAVANLDDAVRTAGSKIGVDSSGLALMRENAREVGVEFNVMAEEVATAQNYLALAGFDLEKTLAATDDLVAAQKASGESMATVADIITDVSTAYRYSAEDLGKVGDMAVYTSSKFNTSVGQLGEAYKYIVPVAKNAGIELNDLNSYLGVLSNNLIKGSQAGTVMRTAVTRITAPTKEAASQMKRFGIEAFEKGTGKFKGFNEVMTQIQKALPKMTDKQRAMFMQTVFGQEAISGLNVIFGEGVDKIIEYGKAIVESDGFAKDAALFKEDGIGGDVRALNKQFEETKLIVGSIFEGVSTSVITDLTDALKNANEELKKNQEENSDFLAGAYEVMKVGTGWTLGMFGDFVGNTADIVNLLSGNAFKGGLEGVGGGFMEIGQRQRAERTFMEQTLTTGGVMDFGGFNPTLNLTLNNNGGIMDRESTNQAVNALNSTLDTWYDRRMKSEMNRLR